MSKKNDRVFITLCGGPVKLSLPSILMPGQWHTKINQSIFMRFPICRQFHEIEGSDQEFKLFCPRWSFSVSTWSLMVLTWSHKVLKWSHMVLKQLNMILHGLDGFSPFLRLSPTVGRLPGLYDWYCWNNDSSFNNHKWGYINL